MLSADPPLDPFALPAVDACATDEAAGDWETIFQLKQLFRRDPGIVGVLLADLPDSAPGYLATIATAVREAVQDGPIDPALSLHAADAFLRSRRLGDAEAILLDLVQTDGEHSAALQLLAQVCAERGRQEMGPSIVEAARLGGGVMQHDSADSRDHAPRTR